MKDETTSVSLSIPEGEPLRSNDWSQPAALMLAFFEIGAGLFLLLTRPEGGDFNGSLRPVLGLAWIAVGLLPLSGLRAGLVVRQDGIEVRSRLRTSNYRWSDIKHFDLRPSIYRSPLRVELNNGQLIRPLGFSMKTSSDRCRGEAMVAELNRRATEARKIPPAPSG